MLQASTFQQGLSFFKGRNKLEGRGIIIASRSHFAVVGLNLLDGGEIYEEQASVIGTTIVGNVKKIADSKGGRYSFNVGPQKNTPVSESDKLIPSLYLQKKPLFLGNTEWPCFGPDVKAETKLPSQLRYEKEYNNWRTLVVDPPSLKRNRTKQSQP